MDKDTFNFIGNHRPETEIRPYFFHRNVPADKLKRLPRKQLAIDQSFTSRKTLSQAARDEQQVVEAFASQLPFNS